MTTTISPSAAETTDRGSRSSLRRTTGIAGLAGATAATITAAAAHRAGVPLEIDGEMIPIAGFAQVTLVGAVIGGILLAVLNRRSRTPHRHFVQATAALTVLSCIPSVMWPDDAATKVVLVATHLMAAAIIIPAIASHARR